MLISRTLLATGLVVALPLAGTAQGLDAKMKAVLPTAAEDRWSGFGWHTNIAVARREAQAQKQGKPVLLWVMNGNPLGCG